MVNLFEEQAKAINQVKQSAKVVPFPSMLITQKELHEKLDYDRNTGIFVWKVSPSFNVKIGDIAGCKDKNGYLIFQVNKRLYKAHRLAWLYVYGSMPDGEIDHINGVPFDNRIVNLRECTHGENQQNKGLKINNKSGHAGVHWYKNYKKWSAQITVNKVNYKLGYFINLEDAVKAYNDAKKDLHKFSPEVRKTSRFFTEQNVKDIKCLGMKVVHKPASLANFNDGDDLPPQAA